MTEKLIVGDMQMIQIDQIDILNPRERNKVAFDEIIANINSIGLKKPITVTPRVGPNDTKRYLLILKKSVELNPTENIQHKFDKPTGGMICV
jgi:ParB family chromosome partitioning protein